MNWVDQKPRLTRLAREYDSSAILMTKDHWFWNHLAAWFVFIFTFGGMKREKFRKKFATTLGPIIACPREMPAITVEWLIPHEVGGHVKQFRWFGFYLPYVGPWLGLIPMAILYGLLLPVGFNWFRYRFELHADSVKWKMMLKQGQPAHSVMARARKFANTVSSWKYGKPIPTKWAVWGFLRVARRITQ